MIPKNIIELAIEGGWKAKGILQIANWEKIVLDKTFWQALGKNLSWEEDLWNGKTKWQRNAYRFYDLILQQQSTESFWAELLQ